MKPKIILLVLLACVHSASTLQAGLQFAETSLSFEAEMGQELTEAIYTFVNDSDAAVTIREVKTSCGCTAPKLEKKVYQPGEEGQVELIFKHETRTGPQTKKAYVIFEDNSKPEVLELKVDIPRAFRIQPPLLFWKDGTSPEPMTATLTFNFEESPEIVDVQSLNPAWAVEALAREGEPGTYDLVVTPKRDVSGERSTVIFTTKPELKHVRLYLRGR